MEVAGWDLSPYVTIDHIFGIIACFMSLALFLHPLPTCWKVWKSQNAGDYQPYPYMAAEAYAMFVTNYAFSLRGECRSFKHNCLYYSTGVGFSIESLYVAVFLVFSHKIQWYKVGSVFLMYFLMFLIPAFGSDWFKLIASEEGRNKVFEPSIIVSGILMYASPLFPIVCTYKTKRVESLPFLLCTTLSLYGVTWTIYACLPSTFDLYFTITNGIGAILAVLQLGVCYALLVKFRKMSATNLDDDVERSSRPNGDGELEQQLLNNNADA